MILVAVSIFAAGAHAVRLTVEIIPVVKGGTFYMDHSEMINETHKFHTYWENWGSVACENRLRVDIYNGTLSDLRLDDGKIDSLNQKNQRLLEHTAWSMPERFNPGTNSDLFAYYRPFNITGNFTAQPRVYSCNEIFYIDPINISIEKKFTNQSLEDHFERVDIKNINKSSIMITLVPKHDMNSTVVVPQKHLAGWVVPYSMFEDMEAGEEHERTLDYKPSVWRPRHMTLGFIIDDGGSYVKKDFIIQEDENIRYTDYLIAGLMLLFVSLVIYKKYMKISYGRNKKKEIHDGDDIKGPEKTD